MKRPRRVFLVKLGAFILLPFTRLSVHGQENNVATIEWRLQREQVKKVRESLSFKGTIQGDPKTVEGSKGLPLVYILVGAVALAELAKTLLDLYRDVQYGAFIIYKDKKTGKLKIENDSKLPGGTIVVSQNDGKIQVLQAQQNPQILDLVKAMEAISKK
ncbi:hypothetical protein [Candidatus Cyanaurora vandensis]|uniref:hypothetical protein n=1 Tax=Candidatus Cyanaurora vandensis TaxID=2714958 RepID=UPI00257B7580|nr:hypothetical protein [Candidatus Cyanaurora vandensis]